MALPAASAHIAIIDIGHYNAAQWDDVEGLSGYVDYQNTANQTIKGAILVFLDNEIAAGRILNMKIRYIAGFRCSPVKTLEFPISETEGDHTIIVHILSVNSSVMSTYDYSVKDVEDTMAAESEREVEEDWLKCWGFGYNG